jgi:hypothetical protein
MPEALPNADPIEGLGFDPEALAAKYRDERSKRLREDGIHQYREAKEPSNSLQMILTLRGWTGNQ